MSAAGTAAVAAATATIAVLCLIAEVGAEPTAVAGIDSSTWTPLTGAGTLLLGEGAFAGSLDPGAVVVGLALLLVAATLLGMLGIAGIVLVQGPLPTPAGAIVQGVAWGVVVQIAVVLLLVNGLQDPNLLHDSLPAWGWWVATAGWGAALGLAGAAALRARASAERGRLTVAERARAA